MRGVIGAPYHPGSSGGKKSRTQDGAVAKLLFREFGSL